MAYLCHLLNMIPYVIALMSTANGYQLYIQLPKSAFHCQSAKIQIFSPEKLLLICSIFLCHEMAKVSVSYEYRHYVFSRTSLIFSIFFKSGLSFIWMLVRRRNRYDGNSSQVLIKNCNIFILNSRKRCDQ